MISLLSLATFKPCTSRCRAARKAPILSALAGVTVNGRSQRDARLMTGDVIEVGANILRVIDAEGVADFGAGFDGPFGIGRTDRPNQCSHGQ